jgi:hypothetical protein
MGNEIKVDQATLRQHASDIRALSSRIQDGSGNARSVARSAATHAGHPAAQGALDSFWGSWEPALGAIGVHTKGLAVTLAAAVDGYELVDNGNGVMFQKVRP